MRRLVLKQSLPGRAFIRALALCPPGRFFHKQLVEVSLDNRVENGMLVMHVKFGLGKVVHTSGDRLYIVFRDQSERTARIFKSSFPGISLAEVQSDPVLDNLTPLSEEGGNWVLPTERLSADAAVAAFLAQWPRGFEDSDYIESERSKREKSHRLFVESFGKGQIAALLADNKMDELATRTRTLVEQANLLSRLEAATLFEALDIDYAARNYFGALNDLLEVEYDETDETDERLEKAFRNYVNVCASLPQVGESRVFAWQNITLLPFLAQPKRHMFLKPVITRRAANTLAFDIGYDTMPNWPTYARLLRMGKTWANITEELGPKDMIDVQSFLYASCGGYDAA